MKKKIQNIFNAMSILTFAMLALINTASAGDTLFKDQWLRVNQQLTSNNGDFKLIMQGDGNLVVYRNSDNKALWSSRTHNNPGAEAVMQGDGNLVVYKNGVALWSTNTHNNPGSRVIMQHDGNLVVYNPANRALWESGTRQLECSTVYVDAWGGRFEWGTWLTKPGSCYEYVPLQDNPFAYYHTEYSGGQTHRCLIYPTYAGKVPVQVCK